eukprot:SM000089S23840  [mRNA]  locus=s89:303770:304545:+ [translate_table: standard]
MKLLSGCSVGRPKLQQPPPAEQPDLGLMTQQPNCSSQLSSTWRAESAGCTHAISTEATWRAAEELDEAILLLLTAGQAARVADGWQIYAVETALERDRVVAWGLQLLEELPNISSSRRTAGRSRPELYISRPTFSTTAARTWRGSCSCATSRPVRTRRLRLPGSGLRLRAAVAIALRSQSHGRPAKPA